LTNLCDVYFDRYYKYEHYIKSFLSQRVNDIISTPFRNMESKEEEKIESHLKTGGEAKVDKHRATASSISDHVIIIVYLFVNY